MNIVPKDFTLHGLLNNPNEQFTIPSYQRRYAWRYNQQAALFKDIDMLLPNDGHLFGMLILHSGFHKGGVNSVDVVDGQQRLTSISILLFALKEKFEEIGNTYNSAQIKQLLYCGNPETSKTTKLVLGELDNADYQNLLKKDFEEIENQRLAEAYDTFTDFIDDGYEDEGEDWLNTFYQKLLHTAKIIRLDVQQAKDAYKLFETINNRGLKLSATDILKNFILGHAAKISEDTLQDVKVLWGKLIMALDGIPSDDFFRQYVTSIYTRKISKTKLIEEFKKHYFKTVKDVDKLGEYRYNYGMGEAEEVNHEEEDNDDDVTIEETENQEEKVTKRISIDEYVGQILKAAQCYRKIWYREFKDSKINQSIKDLQNIRSFTSYIYLMHYLQLDKPRKDVLKIMKMIAALMLRRHMTGKSTAYNDDIFANILRIDFEEENYLKLIKNQLKQNCPDDDEFQARFPTHEMKNRVIDRARYILTQIEYYLTGDTGELSVNKPEDVHVEHIIPQTITTKSSKSEFGDWEEYLGDKARIIHKQKVNRIGNLTLLSGSLNISAYNNPFAKKKKSYRESNLRITQELADQSNFRFHHLDKRGQYLAEIATKIWKL